MTEAFHDSPAPPVPQDRLQASPVSDAVRPPRLTPGRLARRVLGRRFNTVGEIYRRIFVDMNKVAEFMIGHIPPGARVLDVGGGDGYVVNLLLSRRPDIHVTMIDVAREIGGFISSDNRPRAVLLPGVDVADVTGSFEVMTVADVIHHVAPADRPAFFAALAGTALRTGCSTVLIKDLQPGNVRATLGLWSDLYITGDKGVAMPPMDTVRLPGLRRTAAAMPDFPNYCLVFERENPPAGPCPD